MHVGLVCSDRNSFREECDHVLHTIDLINNHSNSFHDELLANAVLKVHTADAGCAEGRALEAFAAIQASLPLQDPTQLMATIGPMCSNDVAVIASAGVRKSDTGFHGLVLSGSSTAISLSNDAEYPNLARFAASETVMAQAIGQMIHHYNWNKIAVIHDDTLFGRDSAAAVIAEFKSTVGETAQVLNEGAPSSEFKRAALQGPWNDTTASASAYVFRFHRVLDSVWLCGCSNFCGYC